MKKTRATVLLIIAMMILPPLCSGESYDFRKSRWGDSRTQIIAAEDRQPAATGPHYLAFEANLLEKEMILKYIFAEDRLIGAKYEPARPHIIDRKYVQDFEDLKTVLIQKYGEPKEDQKIWKGGDFFQKDPSQWGFAVSTGKLTCRSAWITDTTEIDLVLTGGDFKITCQINYWSRKLKHLMAPVSPDIQMKKEISDSEMQESMDQM